MHLQPDEEFVPVHPSHRGTMYRRKGKKKKKKMRRRPEDSPARSDESPHGYIKKSPTSSPRPIPVARGGDGGKYVGPSAAGRRNVLYEEPKQYEIAEGDSGNYDAGPGARGRRN